LQGDCWRRRKVGVVRVMSELLLLLLLSIRRASRIDNPNDKRVPRSSSSDKTSTIVTVVAASAAICRDAQVFC